VAVGVSNQPRPMLQHLFAPYAGAHPSASLVGTLPDVSEMDA